MSDVFKISPTKAGEKEFGAQEREQLIEYLQAQGYDLTTLDEDNYFQEKIQRAIMNQGATKCLDQSLICESVLPVSDDTTLLTSIIKCHLGQLQATQELLVIDPYFFPDRVEQASYLTMLLNTFRDAVKGITNFKVVAKPGVNRPLKNEFFIQLKKINPQLQTYLTESDDFHDRFIIADGQRGAFIGTSLNGIGRKYALIDYMRDEDAQEIYQACQEG